MDQMYLSLSVESFLNNLFRGETSDGQRLVLVPWLEIEYRDIGCVVTPN